ncbi:MAG: hypothetical protein ACR2QK_09245 [Acidimicrobiales bacterium]
MVGEGDDGLTTGSAVLPLLVAGSYVVVGAAFFADPSQSATTGSDEYWGILADESPARRVFLLGFAMTGLFAIGAIGSIRALIRPRPSGFVQWGFWLGYLGYAVTAVSYFRILSGEALRARAFSDGDQATQEAIASFSIGLDPQGWLMFGATGVFLAVVNAVAVSRSAWPRWLAAIGGAIAVLSLVAWFGLVTDRSQLVNIAVGAGGIVLGPIWWAGLGVVIWRRRG